MRLREAGRVIARLAGQSGAFAPADVVAVALTVGG
jgi:hypothetical protein